MPRFHFNVRNATIVVYDREKIELATLAEARDEAILDTCFAMSDAIRDGRDLSRMVVIDVCDAQGRVLLTVPYGDAILPEEPDDPHGTVPRD